MIFAVLGTPDTNTWPEVEKLPCYLPFSATKPKDLANVLEDAKNKNFGDFSIKPEFVTVVHHLLALNPSHRIDAAKATEMLS